MLGIFLLINALLIKLFMHLHFNINYLIGGHIKMCFSVFKSLNYVKYESEQRDANHRLTPESWV